MTDTPSDKITEEALNQWDYYAYENERKAYYRRIGILYIKQILLTSSLVIRRLITLSGYVALAILAFFFMLPMFKIVSAEEIVKSFDNLPALLHISQAIFLFVFIAVYFFIDLGRILDRPSLFEQYATRDADFVEALYQDRKNINQALLAHNVISVEERLADEQRFLASAITLAQSKEGYGYYPVKKKAIN